MNHYEVFRLTADDTKHLQELSALFADVFDDRESYAAQPPSEEYLQRFLADESHIVIVAMQDDRVVGGLVAYHLEKFERERSEVYVYDLAVSTNQQRKGIGKTLMTKLQDIARDLGAYVVFVQADEGDDAVKFYRSLRPSSEVAAKNFDFNLK